MLRLQLVALWRHCGFLCSCEDFWGKQVPWATNHSHKPLWFHTLATLSFDNWLPSAILSSMLRLTHCRECFHTLLPCYLSRREEWRIDFSWELILQYLWDLLKIPLKCSGQSLEIVSSFSISGTFFCPLVFFRHSRDRSLSCFLIQLSVIYEILSL